LAVKKRELYGQSVNKRRLYRRSASRQHQVPDHDVLRDSLLASFSRYFAN
jgi:hypothetical protein